MPPADHLSGLVIDRFDPQAATATDFKSLNALSNLIKREGWPSESPTKWDELERDTRFQSSYSERQIWRAQCGSRLVGLATLEFGLTEYNRHAANFFIEVHPEARRNGTGRALLGEVAHAAREANRRLLIAWTTSIVPAGEAFMLRMGAQPALQMFAYQLELRDLNRSVVSAWLAKREALEAELEFGWWEGPYPETDIDAIAEMHAVMNTMPRGDLELEDEVWTPAVLREGEAVLRHQGIVRCTAFARCRVTGKIAGYSEVFWNPYQPTLVNQGDTGVFPEWRNRGLASYLKAAMLARVMDQRPQVRRVRTWNAASNEPMIAINEHLGFRLQHKTVNWQVSLPDVESYLAS